MKSRKILTSKHKKTPFIIFSLILAFGLTGCGGNSTGSDPDNDSNIVQLASQDDQLSTFSQIVIDAELEGKLSTNGSYTVFVPSDSAFNDLPNGFIDSLTNNQLQEVLNYHIVSEKMLKSDITGKESLKTDQGGSVFINEVGNTIELNHNARVTDEDIEASNGVIQKIDEVLLPDSYLSVFGVIHKRYSLKTFACHCTSGRTNLDNVLRNKDSEFTVFAPNEAAFENYNKNVDDLSDSELEHILNYHVINEKIMSDEFTDGQSLTTRNGENMTISVSSDGTISINGDQAVVQQADLEGANGVVYIVDSVIDPHQ